MAKTHTIQFSDFMEGKHKKKKSVGRMIKRTSIALPVLTGLTTRYAFAADPTAMPVGASEWMGEQTLKALAHVLDPVVDILVALSLPVASVVIVGACFLFMLGNSEKAWGMICNAGLGYVLVQVSPLILNVLKQIGNAV